MNLTERFRSRRGRGGGPDPDPESPMVVHLPTDAASLHIDRDGQIVIDLRDPVRDNRSLTTTDMTCSNCDARLRVERLDTVANRAEMACPDCGFRFSQRVTSRVDPHPR